MKTIGKDGILLRLAKDMYPEKDDLSSVEVKTLFDTAYVKAQELILAHMDKLHAVAQKLLEKETIT